MISDSSKSSSRSSRTLSQQQHQLRLLRYMVRGFQCLGSFPYFWDWSGDPLSPPRFSVAMCLWSIFTRLVVSADVISRLYFYAAYKLDRIDEVVGLVVGCGVIITYGIFSWLVCAFHQSLIDMVFALRGMGTCRDSGWQARITDVRTLMMTLEIFVIILAVEDIVISNPWSVTEKIYHAIGAMIPGLECFLFVAFFMESFRIQGGFIVESVEWVVGGEKDNPIQQHQYPDPIHPHHIHDFNSRTDYVLPRLKILEQRVSQVRIYLLLK